MGGDALLHLARALPDRHSVLDVEGGAAAGALAHHPGGDPGRFDRQCHPGRGGGRGHAPVSGGEPPGVSGDRRLSDDPCHRPVSALSVLVWLLLCAEGGGRRADHVLSRGGQHGGWIALGGPGVAGLDACVGGGPVADPAHGGSAKRHAPFLHRAETGRDHQRDWRGHRRMVGGPVWSGHLWTEGQQFLEDARAVCLGHPPGRHGRSVVLTRVLGRAEVHGLPLPGSSLIQKGVQYVARMGHGLSESAPGGGLFRQEGLFAHGGVSGTGQSLEEGFRGARLVPECGAHPHPGRGAAGVLRRRGARCGHQDARGQPDGWHQAGGGGQGDVCPLLRAGCVAGPGGGNPHCVRGGHRPAAAQWHHGAREFGNPESEGTRGQAGRLSQHVPEHQLGEHHGQGRGRRSPESDHDGCLVGSDSSHHHPAGPGGHGGLHQPREAALREERHQDSLLRPHGVWRTQLL
ncbi:hypothetical protein STIAU_0190 [Stigmatella aurantiaca DW4/3-1]|uniref:Uncharacterized protein n=1 Tax=Stigmatella aurantiaca (strain DW4/3-1) TaxID=378806 RepID=Q08W55_STIAD|nr:hypothetical protein STIAU_0190 [Stigmatella aurantiaca DW4/3-1]